METCKKLQVEKQPLANLLEAVARAVGALEGFAQADLPSRRAFGLAMAEELRAAALAMGRRTLLCPWCARLHIDRGEWETKPHRTHLCEFCGTQWRQFEFPTFGVALAVQGSSASRPVVVQTAE